MAPNGFFVSTGLGAPTFGLSFGLGIHSAAFMVIPGGQLWAHLLSLKSQKFACDRTIEMKISRQMMKEEMFQNCLKYLEIQ